jgi:Sec-independent protein secretion pathway component TatC
MTLMVFSAPMVLLYVISIGVAWMFAKKRNVDEDA